jgi:hypothetical protein
MRLTTIIAASIAIGSAVPAGAQSPVADEPIVQVGLYSYRADGTGQGFAYDTEPADPQVQPRSFGSVVYVSGSFCQIGAGKDPAPAQAADAWRFAGRVVSKTAEEAVVQLDWQRILENGRPTSTPGGSVQLTLKPGDQVLLDSLLPRTQTSCSTAEVRFEARYRSRFSDVPNRRDVIVNGSRAGGGGRSSGTGGGIGAAGSGTTAVRISPGSASGGGRGTSGAARIAPGARMVNVNLWLVHSAPGREDEVQHQELQATHEGAAFAFRPVAVTGEGGAASVQVTGSFAVNTNPQSGDQQLVFITSRRVTRGGDQPRDAADVAGTSRIVKTMPGPDDVLSFEMPPIRAANGRPAPRDQFAVRLRIAPQ